MTAPTQDAATDVVLARQPIFDADLRISAFELLYRAVGEDGLPAATRARRPRRVLVAALDRRRPRAARRRPARVHQRQPRVPARVPAAAAARRPRRARARRGPDRRRRPDGRARRARSTAGFTLALDNFSYRPEYEPLLRPGQDRQARRPGAAAPDELAQHVRRLRDCGPRRSSPRRSRPASSSSYCRQLGIDGFQGYFFARPAVMAERVRADAPARRAGQAARDRRGRLRGARGDDQPRRRAQRTSSCGWPTRPTSRRAAGSARSATRCRCSAAARSAAGRCCSMLAGAPRPAARAARDRARARAAVREARRRRTRRPRTDRGFTVGLFSIADALLAHAAAAAARRRCRSTTG